MREKQFLSGFEEDAKNGQIITITEIANACTFEIVGCFPFSICSITYRSFPKMCLCFFLAVVQLFCSIVWTASWLFSHQKHGNFFSFGQLAFQFSAKRNHDNCLRFVWQVSVLSTRIIDFFRLPYPLWYFQVYRPWLWYHILGLIKRKCFCRGIPIGKAWHVSCFVVRSLCSFERLL